jgi:hypothetical protein
MSGSEVQRVRESESLIAILLLPSEEFHFFAMNHSFFSKNEFKSRISDISVISFRFMEICWNTLFLTHP